MCLTLYLPKPNHSKNFHQIIFISHLFIDVAWKPENAWSPNVISADLILGPINKDKPAQAWYNGRFSSGHYNDTIAANKKHVGCSADEKNGEYSILCFFQDDHSKSSKK